MSLKLEELVGKSITEAQFDEAAGEKDACFASSGQLLKRSESRLSQRRTVDQHRLVTALQPPGATPLAIPIRRKDP